MRYMYERIFDPELGEGLSSTEYIYKKYYDVKDSSEYFISFTDIDKLGINPKSKYNTPLGIYTYPIKEFFTYYVDFNLYGPESIKGVMKNKIGAFAPFAGNTPFVWVLKVKRNAGHFIDNISDMSTRDYENYKNEIIDMFYDLIITDTGVYNNFVWDFLNNEGYYTVEQVRNVAETKTMKTQVIPDILGQWALDADNKNPGGMFWNVTRNFANQKPVKWNALFRKLGIIGIADRSGAGIIHPSEKMQTVFFSIKSFDIVDKIQNVKAAKKDKEKIFKEVKQILLKFFHTAHNYLDDTGKFAKYYVDVYKSIADVVEDRDLDTDEFYELMRRFFKFTKNVYSINNSESVVRSFGSSINIQLNSYNVEYGKSFGGFKSTRKAFEDIWL